MASRRNARRSVAKISSASSVRDRRAGNGGQGRNRTTDTRIFSSSCSRCKLLIVSALRAVRLALRKLAAVGLGPEVGELVPSELSGGMQKRVALARAIAAEPEIIFFDEPTTGLDPIMAQVINELIVKCVTSLGATARKLLLSKPTRWTPTDMDAIRFGADDFS